MSKPKKENLTIEEIAESHYDPLLPYHNFGHALQTIERAKEILGRFETEGLEVDPDVVYYALLFHDAGYRENAKEKGFESKEHYAAHLAVDALTHAGFGSDFIRRVRHAIIGTHRDIPFTTIEQQVVRVADLGGLSAEYEEFKKDSDNLKKEKEMLSGQKMTMEEWKKSVRETINFYLKQEFKLMSVHDTTYGDAGFHRKVSANLARYLKE